MGGNLIGIAGIVVLLAIAFAFSSNRKAIHLRVVGAAFALQAAIAAFVLYFDWGRRAINWLSGGVLAVINYSRAGIDMVFGPLADIDVIGFSFAVNVLPIIIFFAALMSVLYHLRVMEWLVRIVGGALHRIIGTGAIESMNAAANIFVGQTEAPLVIKPFVDSMTKSELHAVMTGGFATVAGGVMAAYVGFWGEAAGVAFVVPALRWPSAVFFTIFQIGIMVLLGYYELEWVMVMIALAALGGGAVT